jgi:hypothetical protein
MYYLELNEPKEDIEGANCSKGKEVKGSANLKEKQIKSTHVIIRRQDFQVLCVIEFFVSCGLLSV